jgi:LysM repeat protein
MKVLRELTFGLLSAAASGLIVLGAISLALVEGIAIQPSLVPEPATITPLVEVQPQAQQQSPEATPAAIEATVTTTPVPTLSVCPPPFNWAVYVIEPGDTVEQLAQLHSITPETLRDANCLTSDVLMPSYILYLPELPPTSTPQAAPPTITPVPCGPPWGWVFYTVRPGDTLFKLSLAYGVSVPQIQFANCMGSSTYIRYGEVIYLPYVRPIRTAVPATRTFTLTPTVFTLTQTTTPNPSATLTYIIPSLTFTPTRTLTPTFTFTATSTPTLTPTETQTPSPTSTATYTSTPTETFTPSPTATFTPVPTTDNTGTEE